jgi:hypothetical protein
VIQNKSMNIVAKPERTNQKVVKQQHWSSFRRRDVIWLLAGLIVSGSKVPRCDGAPHSAAIYVPDKVDQAVSRAIDFLIKEQKPDGSIFDRQNNSTMTALAIMAMASIGIVPSTSDARGRVMANALDYVLIPENQNASGYFGQRFGCRMYGHGITTLMLTEMMGMGVSVDQNRRIHQALIKAIDLILASQAVNKETNLKGGWRYEPNSRDSDLSVTVWQVMALRSAKNDGMNVPGEAIDAAVNYLKKSYSVPVGQDGNPTAPVGGFTYIPQSSHATFTMTAAGLLALQVCGLYDTPMVTGAAEWLLKNPPNPSHRFFYYGMYYYAQGLHQVGGNYAAVAEQLVSDTLLPLQKDDGSFQPNGEENQVGSVYSTAMAILSLTVRYHYLPIYQR